MSETANIAEIAEILSQEIFPVFGWAQAGPINHPWDCVELEKHHKKRAKVHPSDVVFRYRDPYRGVDIYLNTDLKSYAATTLEAKDLAATIKDLAMAVECANKSPGWQSAYLTNGNNHEVAGLLFIYNHDGEYDKSFPALLTGVTVGQLKVDRYRRVFIMGPDRVAYLNTIAKDILQQRGAKNLPDAEACYFYYPDLENAKATSRKHRAATVEMLLGPWQILRFNGFGGKSPGYYFYSPANGKSDEEFLYILDYIFTYQLLGDEDTICIRLPFAAEEAAPAFKRALKFYAEEFWPIEGDSKKEFEQRLSRISLKKITDIATVFSKTEIGMTRHV